MLIKLPLRTFRGRWIGARARDPLNFTLYHFQSHFISLNVYGYFVKVKGIN